MIHLYKPLTNGVVMFLIFLVMFRMLTIGPLDLIMEWTTLDLSVNFGFPIGVETLETLDVKTACNAMYYTL